MTPYWVLLGKHTQAFENSQFLIKWLWLLKNSLPSDASFVTINDKIELGLFSCGIIMKEKFTVLIVDDDPLSLEYYRSIIIPVGLDVITCESVTSAKQIIQSNSMPDMILTDIVMKTDTCGIELLKWTRQHYPHIPVLLSTDLGSKNTAISALKLGALDFFEKTTRIEKITSTLEQIIKTIESERQLELMRARTRKMDKLATIGVMASTIIHDIKNPLFKVDIKMQQALSKFEKDPSKSKNKIEEATELLQSVFKIITTQLAQLHGDKIELKPSSAQKIIDDAIAIAIPNLSSYRIKLIRDIPEKIIEFPCHHMQVIQVLANLLNNAAHAIQKLDERWIKISLVEDEAADKVYFTVTDSGSGIPVEIQEKIFEILFTTKSSDEGTGLGLGIARNMIRQQKGDLFLDKTAANTQFVVSMLKQQPPQNP